MRNLRLCPRLFRVLGFEFQFEVSRVSISDDEWYSSVKRSSSEVDVFSASASSIVRIDVQGYLAHKNLPPSGTL